MRVITKLLNIDRISSFGINNPAGGITSSSRGSVIEPGVRIEGHSANLYCLQVIIHYPAVIMKNTVKSPTNYKECK